MALTNKEREILQGQLAAIDRRRAELEIVLASVAPEGHHCFGCAGSRQELEAELRDLWRHRLTLAEQLRS
jgi:hypothetical protein